MKEKGGLQTEVIHTRDIMVPKAFFDPKSLKIVRLLINEELLPEDICNKTSYDENAVVPILLELHVHGILKRKQKGFKGYYSISKDRVLMYCEILKTLSKKWEALLKEMKLGNKTRE